ncbi:MAG TPA: MauE/DoxX family redox-associated membrane protein [Candidatus Desulfaltia sp.]|nr:MauE/DoxX family redox-associated membrane protein [Candidatus Desulfaltia sp.]
MIRNRWLLLVFRLVVGGVFIWAGVLKVVDPLGFAQSIMNYQTFPRALAFIIALVLPWVEVIAGGLLIVGLFKRSSAVLISLMLIGFIGLVALALARGIDTSCGCFGSFSRRADLTLILTDLGLLYLALCVFFAKPK